MITYLFINLTYLLVCFVLVIVDKYTNLSRMQKLFIIVGLIILNSFIAAFRPIESPDTINYIRAYEGSSGYISNHEVSGIGDLLFDRSYLSMEVFFVVFMAVFKKLFFSIRVFFFVVSLLVSASSLIGLSLCAKYLDTKTEGRNYIDPFPVWFVYMVFCGTIYTAVAIRAGLAMGFGLCFVGLWLNKKNKVAAVILLCLAMLFHSTGITVIIIVLLLLYGPSFIKTTHIVGTGLILSLLYVIRISNITTPIMVKIVMLVFSVLGINAFSSYFTDLSSAFKMRELFFICVVLLLLVLSYTKEHKVSKMGFVVMLGVMFYVFCSGIDAISREADYFIIFIVPIISYYLYNNSKQSDLIVVITSLALIVPQYVMVFLYS